MTRFHPIALSRLCFTTREYYACHSRRICKSVRISPRVLGQSLLYKHRNKTAALSPVTENNVACPVFQCPWNSYSGQCSGVASYGALGHVTTRLPTISFLVHFGVNLTANYPSSVVCEISWCRCQRLTALSISTALVTKLLVIEQLLHPALKFAVNAPWHNFQLCPSSQQILATPLGQCLRCCRQ